MAFGVAAGRRHLGSLAERNGQHATLVLDSHCAFEAPGIGRHESHFQSLSPGAADLGGDYGDLERTFEGDRKRLRCTAPVLQRRQGHPGGTLAPTPFRECAR